MARRVVLGITGSIAAVKAPELVRLLLDKGFEVECFMTDGAKQFASPTALATFSGRPVVDAMFGEDAWRMPHLRAENPDVFLIAPISASTLGRCAHGIADDVVSLAYMTTTAPVLMAPAMHPTMWEHPATQANVRILRERGVTFVGPYIGPLADKSHGEGRMSEPSEIADAVEKATDARSKKG